MAEVAPSAGGGGSNRGFLVLIGLLAVVLFVGLLALGAIFVLPGLGGFFGGAVPQIAAVTTTPTRIVIPNTATRSALPTLTLVIVAEITETPTVAPTDTPLPPDTATPIPITATPIFITATPQVQATPTSGSNLPPTGLGEDLAMLFGGGLLLLGVIVVARRMRSV